MQFQSEHSEKTFKPQYSRLSSYNISFPLQYNKPPPNNGTTTLLLYHLLQHQAKL